MSRQRNFATLRVLIVVALASGGFVLLGVQREIVAVNAPGAIKGPELVIYTDPGFSGRSLSLTQSVRRLPKSFLFDWNDQISCVVVHKGTWRLYENAEFNTKFSDDIPDQIDLEMGAPVGGWSCVVSAQEGEPLRFNAGAGGFGDNSISSIELVSSENLSSPDRIVEKGVVAEPAELIVYEHVGFDGRRLQLSDSVPDFRGLSQGWGLSSLKVVKGTWTLYQHPNFGTEPHTGKKGGWHTTVSGSRIDFLRQAASESGGWTNDDVGSIELVARENILPQWALLNRELLHDSEQ